MGANLQARYEIESSHYVCRRCAAEIPCEGAYYSAISYDAAEFRRHDYCLDCWSVVRAAWRDEPSSSADSAELESAPIYAFWRTRRPPMPSAQPRRVRFDTELVYSFFRRLCDGSAKDSGAESVPADDISGAQRAHLAFVFALLLIRKKVLELTSTVEREGREWLKITEKKDRERHYWVLNPNLGAEELELVRDRIGELLQMQM